MDLQKLFNIEGKTALITGGSRGIGEMIAAGFLANGAKVYITARKEAPLKRLYEGPNRDHGHGPTLSPMARPPASPGAP